MEEAKEALAIVSTAVDHLPADQRAESASGLSTVVPELATTAMIGASVGTVPVPTQTEVLARMTPNNKNGLVN